MADDEEPNPLEIVALGGGDGECPTCEKWALGNEGKALVVACGFVRKYGSGSQKQPLSEMSKKMLKSIREAGHELGLVRPAGGWCCQKVIKELCDRKKSSSDWRLSDEWGEAYRDYCRLTGSAEVEEASGGVSGAGGGGSSGGQGKGKRQASPKVIALDGADQLAYGGGAAVHGNVGHGQAKRLPNGFVGLFEDDFEDEVSFGDRVGVTFVIGRCND